ncbi:MAG: S8 family serine peptidase [Planctomycetota bacterium]
MYERTQSFKPIVLVILGCTLLSTNYVWAQPEPSMFEYEDPLNLIHSVVIAESGEELSYDIQEIPEDWFDLYDEPEEDKDEVEFPDEPDRVHPLLLEWLNDDPTRVVPVIIMLRDELAIPRFPILPERVTRDSPEGQAIMGEVEAVIEALTAERIPATEQFVTEVVERFQIELPILEQFWLVSGFLTELPLWLIPDLTETGELLNYIQPQFAGEEPPVDNNANNDVDDGRFRIISEPYFNAVGQMGTYIGLLDTGIRSTHVLFNNPSHLGLLFDCMTSGCCCSSQGNCNTGDVWGHGTSTAAILVGNNRLGDAYRGVTAMTLDSFRIYNPYLNSAAAVKGFQCAIKWFDRVIVGEIQSSEGKNGAIAAAADNAFEAGVTVVAANGNYGGKGAKSVASPGSAHKAIGVGAYDVASQDHQNSQGLGPTHDGRFKPDFQGPTNTETACRNSDNCMGVFTATSGSTPYGAGAAALVRRWLGAHGTWDPGSVYAFLINSGTLGWPHFDNKLGVGQLRLPVNGSVTWGKVSVNQGTVINLKINVTAGRHTLHAGLWWPEGLKEKHDDIDVYLVDPSGQKRAKSVSGISVFELARVTGPLDAGHWTIRIKGHKVQSGPQKVYWTAAWHN